MPALRHRLARGAVVGAALAACTRPLPNWPVTEQGRPLAAMDSSRRGAAPPVAQAVTPERLVRARTEPHNWLTYYGAYDGQRFSALEQITRANVASLRPAWVFQASPLGLTPNPATYSFEAAPIVVDGVMYVSGWEGYVWALDAATGDLLWQYQHAIPLDVPTCCGNVNRGVAIARGIVYVATLHGYLVALDAVTGRPRWQQPFADVRAGESATAAPLVVKNLVLVGSSGAEFGVRGHLDAFDAATGRHVWRRYTVPKPGEPGSESWPAQAWARGGGTTWITGTYDPELDLVYWGTGNPGPLFDGGPRPGSNLYTSAVIAIDPDDGAIRWHYQWTPHDVWDYDGVNENILFELEGRKLLAHFDKNGFLYILDRTDGRFVRATRFARATWGDVDATTGRVTPRLIPTPEGVDICPGPAGAKEWPHATYSPRTRLLYTPVVEACARFKRGPTVYQEGLFYLGGDADVRPNEQWGEVKAFDPATGRQVWTWRSPHPVVASLLSTATDLLFVGEANGYVNALDARSGEVLWRFNTGNGIHSNPVTYSVRGKQYVAVPNGWGGWIEGYAPELFGQRRGTALHVFALP
ncbi:MAG TPA: PQQ-dependent dehydrogenase, methanol/ethanol family [Gemmatimonadaceae bacterium]|nr:PQQ-dependent dehydrogenase, methanol/ethanol family [Gemmatimonadaceae bacterium]